MPVELSDLPDEVLSSIFQYLGSSDLRSVGSTSRRLRQLALDDRLWQSLVRREHLHFYDRVVAEQEAWRSAHPQYALSFLLLLLLWLTIFTLSDHSQVVADVVWRNLHPRGERLASNWATGRHEMLELHVGRNRRVFGIELLPTGHVVTAADDRELRVWDGATGNPLLTYVPGYAGDEDQ